MGGHFRLRNSVFERFVYRGLKAIVSLSEGNNRSIRHSVSVAIPHRIRYQLKLLARLPNGHLQPARIAGNLFHYAYA
jgi:hypothetical protein